MPAADLDGDGDLDIVSQRGYQNSDMVWFAQGASFTFTRNTIVSNGGGYGFALADFDNDGDVDIAEANWGGSAIYIYTNNGSGSFTQNNVGSSSTSDHIDAADLDGDGDVDFALTASGQREEWFRQTGALTFTPTTLYSGGGSEAEGVDIADVDGDGDNDLIFVALGTHLRVYYNDGAGGFASFTDITPVSQPFYAVGGDADGDGDTDIALVDQAPSSNVWIYENTGGGWTQRAVGTLTSSGFALGHLAFADVDGDGDADLVGATSVNVQFQTGEVAWFEQTAAWTYTKWTLQSSGSYGVGAVDIDGNGCVDVLNADNIPFYTRYVIYRNLDCPLGVGAEERSASGGFDVEVKSLPGGFLLSLPHGFEATVEVYGMDGRLVSEGVAGARPFVFNAPAAGVWLWRVSDGVNAKSGSAAVVR